MMVGHRIVGAENPKDVMAEMVAEGGTVEYAGRALGLSPAEGRALWAQVCRDVGESVLA